MVIITTYEHVLYRLTQSKISTIGKKIKGNHRSEIYHLGCVVYSEWKVRQIYKVYIEQ